MLDLDLIIHKLQDRNITKIMAATDLPRGTITNIRDRVTKSPGYQILKTLSDYFEKQDGIV